MPRLINLSRHVLQKTALLEILISAQGASIDSGIEDQDCLDNADAHAKIWNSSIGEEIFDILRHSACTHAVFSNAMVLTSSQRRKSGATSFCLTHVEVWAAEAHVVSEAHKVGLPHHRGVGTRSPWRTMHEFDAMW